LPVIGTLDVDGLGHWWLAAFGKLDAWSASRVECKLRRGTRRVCRTRRLYYLGNGLPGGSPDVGDDALPVPADLLDAGGLNSGWARTAFVDRLAGYPTHPRHAIRRAVFALLEDHAAGQAAKGWPEMPEAHRRLAVGVRLHLHPGLPEDFRASVAYRAYYFSLSPMVRKAARARGHGVYITWSPASTFFV